MTIFDKNKISWSCDTLFHSKSSICDLTIIFVQKLHSWGHLAVKIEIFENFSNGVIMTGSEQTPRIHVWSCSVVHYWAIGVENKIVTVSLTVTEREFFTKIGTRLQCFAKGFYKHSWILREIILFSSWFLKKLSIGPASETKWI